MNVLKTRKHQIAFRLSREEYEKLCQYCASTGARSISDLARSAVCQFTGITSDGIPDPVVGRMQLLDLRMQQMDRKLDDLTAIMRRERVPTGQ